MTTMRFWLRLSVCVTCGGYLLAPATVASQEGQIAAQQVSLASYQGFLNNSLYTHSGHSRGPSGAQHDPARDNILALFQSYGLPAALEPFTYGGQSGENVVATLVGTLYPNQIYVIGGHYDSVSNPGADDNASGVAAVLEVARVLCQYSSDYTIKFVAFDLEELGLYGSHAYCNAHAADDIRGMVSLDMVCYDPNTDHALIYGRTASNPIKNAIAAAVDEYAGGLTTTINGTLDASDHAPFEAQGWQACLLIEGDFWSNPFYHTQQDSYDSPGYLNFSYAVKMTRSIIGWLVDEAGVNVPVDRLDFAYPYGLPELSFPDGSTTVRVEVTGIGNVVPLPDTGQLNYYAGGGWQTVPLTVAAPNIYNAELPPEACGETLSYYFSAQAVGGQWYYDPYGGAADPYTASVSYGTTVAYENSLDTNPGWAISGGEWAFGHPTGQGGSSHGYPDPANGATGSNVYGVNLAGDYSLTEGGPYHLTAGPFDLSSYGGVALRFARWLNTDYQPYVYADLAVSNNGSTWTGVWTNGGSEITANSWSAQAYDIAAVADHQASVFVRWTYQIGNGAWAYTGWNIDDVQLTALRCDGPELTPGDLDCDGDLDFDDINPFVLALSDVDEYRAEYQNCPVLNADCNFDGLVNFDDINPFVDLLTP